MNVQVFVSQQKIYFPAQYAVSSPKAYIYMYVYRTENIFNYSHLWQCMAPSVWHQLYGTSCMAIICMAPAVWHQLYDTSCMTPAV
jgi:hypothetical protein